MRKLILVAAVVVGLLLGTSPAEAAKGRLEWKDAVDDASLPGPASQPRLDIISSVMAFDGTALNWTAKFKSLSTDGVGPQALSLGTGAWYGFLFNYGDGAFTFRLTLDAVAGDSFAMQRASGDNEVSTVSCVKCTMKADRAENTVTLRAPLSAIASGVRLDAPKDPLGPGKTIDSVRAAAGYTLGAPAPVGPLVWFGAADTATPPEDAEFTF